MNVTEQIDAMQVSDNNPFKYLVVTRILSATFMLPLLVIFADGVGLMGSFVGVNIKGNVSAYLFFSQIFQSLEFADLFPAVLKTFFFGFGIGLIATYKGYYSNKGSSKLCGGVRVLNGFYNRHDSSASYKRASKLN
jgi:phospholipid/cholesterol/gamma-HCH transport system permease protein